MTILVTKLYSQTTESYNKMYRKQAVSAFRIVQRRLKSTAVKETVEESPFGTIPTTKTASGEVIVKQAPNRTTLWSESQQSKDALIKNKVNFVDVDLGAQPNPQAAIDLINKQPVYYIHDRIAVCNGTDFSQGHPKIYINLDKDKVGHCGYCGARFARTELKGKIEEI